MTVTGLKAMNGHGQVWTNVSYACHCDDIAYDSVFTGLQPGNSNRGNCAD